MNEEKQNTGESMPSMDGESRPKKSKAGLGWAIILGVVLIVLVLVILDRVVGVNIFTSPIERQQEEVSEFLAETGAWHAVFLTNGQVYFGQLSNTEAQYAMLKDIYYLQLQPTQAQPPAPVVDPNVPEGEAQVVSAPTPEPPRLTLIKFGTELHRPSDMMQINRDHILFWEELTAESQVVQAIQNYKQSQ